MTAPEIHGIIAACARANVRRISVPGLHLELGEGTHKVPMTSPPVAEPTRANETTLSEEQHEKQNEESMSVEELRLKSDRLAMMLIEDPATYERLMLSGELDAATEGDDD